MRGINTSTGEKKRGRGGGGDISKITRTLKKLFLLKK